MTTMTEEKQVVGVPEASRILDVHPSTIRRAIRTGQLKAFKLSQIGGRFKIHIDELQKLFNKPIETKTQNRLENTKESISGKVCNSFKKQ